MATIGIIGDLQPDNPTHAATTEAFGSEAEWVATDQIGGHDLGRFHGLLIAPGSPYRDLDGALRAIAHARTEGVPLLGTCGGFQHIVIEFARNVLGIAAAGHAEYDPATDDPFVTRLSCSLAGQELDVNVDLGSVAGRAYGNALHQGVATERYYCNFGLDPQHEAALETAGLIISGRDPGGEARIIELPGHPFFVGTLFVPQAAGPDHPLVTAFLAAAETRRQSARHTL